MLRFLSSGESHGQAMSLIIEGLPAGLPLDLTKIDRILGERQSGHGRGARMKIEKDQVKVISGLRYGQTLGSPLCLQVENLDSKNWQQKMSISEPTQKSKAILLPRPGHADLVGLKKYDFADIRNVLERASARETVNRVLAGAIAAQLLEKFSIRSLAHVIAIADQQVDSAAIERLGFSDIEGLAQADDLRCADPRAAQKMRDLISQSRSNGDSLGGLIEVQTIGLPMGLGSHVHWDRRLDGRLAQAVLSIPAIKGFEIGPAFENCHLPGSQVMDPICGNEEQIRDLVLTPAKRAANTGRTSNRAGGIEGGISNGQPLQIRAAMKPIPTMRKKLSSIDLGSGKEEKAFHERSDVCAVPACSVVCREAVNWVLAQAFLEVYGADSFAETIRRFESMEN
jgi:chorismate synthase